MKDKNVYPTTRIVSLMLGIPESRLDRWVREGRIPAVRRDERGWRRFPTLAIQQVLRLVRLSGQQEGAEREKGGHSGPAEEQGSAPPVEKSRQKRLVFLTWFAIGVLMAISTMGDFLAIFGGILSSPIMSLLLKLIETRILPRIKYSPLKVGMISYIVLALALGFTTTVIAAPKVTEWIHRIQNNQGMGDPGDLEPQGTSPAVTRQPAESTSTPPPASPTATPRPPESSPSPAPTHPSPTPRPTDPPAEPSATPEPPDCTPTPEPTDPPTPEPTDLQPQAPIFHKFDRGGACRAVIFPEPANPQGWSKGPCP